MDFTRKMIVIFCSVVIIALLSIFYLFYYNINNYIQNEFLQRLEDEAFTTAKLVENFHQKSYDILRQIDDNTVDKSLEKNEIVLNEAGNVLYESHKPTEGISQNEIEYTPELLVKINENGKYQTQKGDLQIVGYYFSGENFPKPLYILLSAKDVAGAAQRNNLKTTMVWSGIFTIIVLALIIGMITRWLSKPYTDFAEMMAKTTEKNLDQKVPEDYNIDHLQIVAQSYNRVLMRLSKAFEQQHYFIQQASHELRTPVALLLSEIETALKKDPTPQNYRDTLSSLQYDTERLTQLINSLLLLYKITDLNSFGEFPDTRVDEIVYKATDEFTITRPECKIKIDFIRVPKDESSFFIKGHTLLLKSAFLNLLENGCKYSNDNKVTVIFDFGIGKNTITFYNDGPIITPVESYHIFEPFYRAQNIGKRKGFGLGLSVTKRVLELHNMHIRYYVSRRGENAFEIAWLTT